MGAEEKDEIFGLPPIHDLKQCYVGMRNNKKEEASNSNLSMVGIVSNGMAILVDIFSFYLLHLG